MLFCVVIGHVKKKTFHRAILFNSVMTSIFTKVERAVKNWAQKTPDPVVEQRRAEIARIRVLYPNRIPVIVTKAKNSDIAEIDKKKYLVPNDVTVGQFLYVIRKRIHLPADGAIFLFINNQMPAMGALMGQLYKDFANDVGFLEIFYSGESTFGFT